MSTFDVSAALVVAGCMALAQSSFAADVPAGTYTNPTAELGVGNNSTGYKLLGNTTFSWQTGTLNGNIDVNTYTLTVDTGGGNPTSLNGALTGSGNLFWIGGGAGEIWQTLPSYLDGSAANTLSGTVTVSRGTLALSKPAGTAAVAGNIVIGGGDNKAILQWQNSNQVADSAAVSLVGAKEAQLKFRGCSETLGTLSLQTDGDIYLGTGSAIIHFAASTGVMWATGKQLIIREWDGLAAGGGTERVIFGSSTSGLTAAQVQQVGFMSPAGFAPGLYRAVILSTGEVVPTGSPVSAVNSPYDLSQAAQAARAAIYGSAGRSSLVTSGTPLKNGMRISFFGDSITWQSNDAAPSPADPATANPENNFSRNSYYFNLLGRALVENGFSNVSLFNHGINGGGVREIEEGTDHQDAAKTLQPPLSTLISNDHAGVVVMFIGINDVWWRNTSTNQFRTSLSNCVQAVKQRGARPVVATMALHGERPDGSNSDDPRIEQYCAITREVAQAAGARLVDLRNVCLAYLRNNNCEIRLDGSFKVIMDHGMLTYDGVHPNDAGSQLIADHIGQGIRGALAANQPWSDRGTQP